MSRPPQPTAHGPPSLHRLVVAPRPHPRPYSPRPASGSLGPFPRSGRSRSLDHGPLKQGAVLLSLGFRQCYGRVVSGAEKFAARRLYAIALSLSGMWRVFHRLVICPGSVVATYCVPVGGIQLPLTSPLIKPVRLPARHRHTHDLFVEVHDPKCELTATDHLRQTSCCNIPLGSIADLSMAAHP